MQLSVLILTSERISALRMFIFVIMSALAYFLFSVFRLPPSASLRMAWFRSKGPHDAAAAADHFKAAPEKKGLTLFDHIDHAAGAAKSGGSCAPLSR